MFLLATEWNVKYKQYFWLVMYDTDEDDDDDEEEDGDDNGDTEWNNTEQMLMDRELTNLVNIYTDSLEIDSDDRYQLIMYLDVVNLLINDDVYETLCDKGSEDRGTCGCLRCRIVKNVDEPMNNNNDEK